MSDINNFHDNCIAYATAAENVLTRLDRQMDDCFFSLFLSPFHEDAPFKFEVENITALSAHEQLAFFEDKQRLEDLGRPILQTIARHAACLKPLTNVHFVLYRGPQKAGRMTVGASFQAGTYTQKRRPTSPNAKDVEAVLRALRDVPTGDIPYWEIHDQKIVRAQNEQDAGLIHDTLTAHIIKAASPQPGQMAKLCN